MLRAERLTHSGFRSFHAPMCECLQSALPLPGSYERWSRDGSCSNTKNRLREPLHLHFWSSFFFHFSKSDFEFDDLHRLCWTGFLLSGRSFYLVTGETATTRAERLFQLLGETYQHGRIVEEETSRRQSHRADYSLCRCRSSCLLEV